MSQYIALYDISNQPIAEADITGVKNYKIIEFNSRIFLYDTPCRVYREYIPAKFTAPTKLIRLELSR